MDLHSKQSLPTFSSGFLFKTTPPNFLLLLLKIIIFSFVYWICLWLYCSFLVLNYMQFSVFLNKPAFAGEITDCFKINTLICLLPLQSLATTTLFSISFFFSQMLQMETRNMKSFRVEFFQPASNSYKLLSVSVVHSFLLLNSIPWCGCTSCLTIHPLKDKGLFLLLSHYESSCYEHLCTSYI